MNPALPFLAVAIASALALQDPSPSPKKRLAGLMKAEIEAKTKSAGDKDATTADREATGRVDALLAELSGGNLWRRPDGYTRSA